MQENFIPVFVFPTTLTFYALDQSTHKQVLTLYNPYDFAVRFQVLCSSHEKNKYSVVDPEGNINAQCCVDIVIRHNAVNNQNIGQTDKFRIQMFQFSSSKVIGRKDIRAELLPGEPEPESDLPHSHERELFQQLPVAGSGNAAVQYPLQRRPARTGSPNGIIIAVAALCATTLLLPAQGEPSTLLPDYLKPTVNLKLVVSYVLGLVTMVLLRPA